MSTIILNNVNWWRQEMKSRLLSDHHLSRDLCVANLLRFLKIETWFPRIGPRKYDDFPRSNYHSPSSQEFDKIPWFASKFPFIFRYYRPHPKDGEGNVFTGVCPSTPGGGGVTPVPGSFPGPFLGVPPSWSGATLSWLGVVPQSWLGVPQSQVGGTPVVVNCILKINLENNILLVTTFYLTYIEKS